MTGIGYKVVGRDRYTSKNETHVESQPGPRTGTDRDGSVEEASNSCDQPIDNMVTICVHEHKIVYSGTDDRNSDIVDMSDFSDDEDEVQEETRPGPRTGSDRDGSVEEALNLLLSETGIFVG